MTNAQQTTKTYTFEVPFNIVNGSAAAMMDLARQDAEDCAALNPGATVKWNSFGSFYWHGEYIVTVPA